MKTSRRGGLGRGLGALIQSTADPVEDAAPAAESKAPSAGEGGVDDVSTHTVEPTADRAFEAPTAAAPGRTRGAAVQEPLEDLETSEGKEPDATGSATTSPKTTGKKKTAKPSQDAPRRSATRRPVDVFFEGSEPETETPSRKTGKNGRPAMPTVTAPGRKTRRTATEDAASQEVPAPAQDASSPAAAGPADAADPEQTTEATVSPSIAVLRAIPVGEIHPNPRQPREVFDEAHMAELVASIREVGVLQPVVVREVEGPTPYELIMGERRWRATQEAGLATIPAIVRQTADEDLLRDALLENLHRSQLNPLEEAAAYQQLMEDFSCTQEELSQRIGRSRPQISNTLRLLRLPPLVQRRVAAGTLSAGHARALLGLSEPAEMERLAQRIVSEGLSVRATEEAVAQLHGAVRPASAARRTRDESTRHERLDYFANALTSRLDTQVKITLGARKGRIAIDFTSVEDLNRIMDLIQGEGTTAPTH